MLLDGNISARDFQEMTLKSDKDIVLMTSMVEELKQKVNPFKIYIHKTIPMLESLVSYYRNANGVRARFRIRYGLHPLFLWILFFNTFTAYLLGTSEAFLTVHF